MYLQDDRHSVADRAATFCELCSRHSPEEHENHHRQSDDDHVECAGLNHCSPPGNDDVRAARTQHPTSAGVDVQDLVSVQVGHYIPDESRAAP